MKTEKPKLRNINAFPVRVSGRQMICLQDPYHFTESQVLLPENVFFIVSLFDGQNSIIDIQEKYIRQYGDIITSDKIAKIIEELDSHLMLESPRFEEHKRLSEEDFKRSSLRTAIHAGSAYESDPDRLKRQIDEFYTDKDGPGKPELNAKPSNDLKGIIAPHIDFSRGGPCYAWAYKEVLERSDADLFIIFGTSHSESKTLFALTKKDFQTPLGIVSTAQDIVENIAKRCKFDVFTDEFNHKFEHSIEFQVIFLQHILGNRKDFAIVPILCSSFHEIVSKDLSPMQIEVFSDFVSVLKEVLAESGRTVCFISGADLSHVGRKFGDQINLTTSLLDVIKTKDLEMLGFVQSLDATGFLKYIQKGKDEQKVCGLPPIYTMLNVMSASSAKILKYSQAVDYATSSVVSFASMAFYL